MMTVSVGREMQQAIDLKKRTFGGQAGIGLADSTPPLEEFSIRLERGESVETASCWEHPYGVERAIAQQLALPEALVHLDEAKLDLKSVARLGRKALYLYQDPKWSVWDGTIGVELLGLAINVDARSELEWRRAESCSSELSKLKIPFLPDQSVWSAMCPVLTVLTKIDLLKPGPELFGYRLVYLGEFGRMLWEASIGKNNQLQQTVPAENRHA